MQAQEYLMKLSQRTGVAPDSLQASQLKGSIDSSEPASPKVQQIAESSPPKTMQTLETTASPRPQIASSPSLSDLEELPSTSQAQKLRKMHKEVMSILNKAKLTKEHLRSLREEVEVTCEEMKNEVEEGKETIEVIKTESQMLDISDISNRCTENVWDEIRNLETMVSALKEKVSSGGDVIKMRQKQGEEIKELINELQGFQIVKSESSNCQCKCELF